MYPYFQQLPIYKMLTIHITFDNVARVNVVIRTAAHADREQCTASTALVVRKLHLTKYLGVCVPVSYQMRYFLFWAKSLVNILESLQRFKRFYTYLDF